MVLLSACAGPTPPLVVKQFMLRDQAPRNTEEPMVKMEKDRRLHGAVSLAERKARLGQYYTLIWSDPQGAGQGEVEVVFQYQQGATASLVKRMVRKFPSSSKEGTVEFTVIGEDYTKGGKVLAWKASVTRGGRMLGTRQSYLWQ